MAVAAILAQYMADNNSKSYYERESVKWNNMHDMISKKLKDQQKYADKWETASEAIDSDWTEQSCTDAKEFRKGTQIFQDKNGGHHGWTKARAIIQYANLCVPKYNPDILEELTDEEMRLDNMVEMCDVMLTELDTATSGEKDRLKTDAQDTHMLNG